MTIKIISDGTAVGTQVVSAETGERIDKVDKIEWEIDAVTQIAKAKITFIAPKTELQVKDPDIISQEHI